MAVTGQGGRRGAYDAIVVGLGACGSAAALSLAERGARVLGLERFTPAHDRGSSHGETRIIRTAYFEDPAYVPLVRRAYALWKTLEQRSGQRLLTPTGALMIGRPESEVVQGTLASAVRWGLPYERLDAGEAGRRFPALRVPEGHVAVYEEQAGALNPEACVGAMLAEAARLGADLRFGERVDAWAVKDGGVEVRSGGTQYRASRLVLSAGAWSPELLGGAVPLVVERQVMLWFRPARPEEASLFDHERMPVFLWERDDRAQFYGIPALEGGMVKFCRHHGGEVTRADDLDRNVRPEDAEAVAPAVARLMPGLEPEPSRARVCMYTNSPDLNFYLGLHPHHEGVAVAAGLSGHGFKFAPAIGEALAGLALDGKSPFDLAPFRLDRRVPPVASSARGVRSS